MTITNADTEFLHIMVDNETLGIQPNRNPVLQMALVYFDPENFTVNDTKAVYFPMDEQIQKGRVVNKETVDWWGKPERRDVLNTILGEMNQAKPCEEGLWEIYRWLDDLRKTVGGGKAVKTVFWAKPVGFDYPFVDGLFLDHGVPSPFHYQQVIDMCSHITSMLKAAFFHTYHRQLPHGVALDMYWRLRIKTTQEEAGAHNAINDCLYQIKWLKIATENTKSVLEHYDLHGDLKDYEPKYL